MEPEALALAVRELENAAMGAEEEARGVQSMAVQVGQVGHPEEEEAEAALELLPEVTEEQGQ